MLSQMVSIHITVSFQYFNQNFYVESNGIYTYNTIISIF